MNEFAAKTTVTANASRDEIERTLVRYGADQFMVGWVDTAATIEFRLRERQIRFVVTMPSRDERRFTHHSRGPRAPEVATKEWEQAVRQRWRALALVIKAKLETVASGITSFEDEFLAQTVLPNKQTAGEWMRPQVAEAYRIGTMPAFLPMLPAPDKPRA